MSGLATIQKKEDLPKSAGEGSLENNVKQLITDEAYSQLSGKFPKLIPMIVGVNIVEMINEKTAVGAAVIGIEDKKMMIPVIYTNGLVDATTFIYSEDEDTLLALTKKVVSMIVSSSPVLTGTVPKEGEKRTFDGGDIRKLFVPPKTYSPKVASEGGLLFAVLEQSPLLKEAMTEKLKDAEYGKAFSEAYGEEAVEFITSNMMEKTACEMACDKTPVEVSFSKNEIMQGDWLNKEAAMQEFAVNGFAISHGATLQTRSLRKVASVETKLKEIIGSDTIQSIDTNHSGVYTVYSLSDLKPIEIVVSREVGSDMRTEPKVISSCRITDSMKNDGNPIIGTQVNASEAKTLTEFSPEKIMNKESVTLVFFKGGEVFGSKRFYGDSDNVTKGLGNTTISLAFSSSVKSIIIEKGSDATATVMGATLHIGSNNVKVLDKQEKDHENVLRMRDLHNDELSTNMVKLAFDGVEYIHDQAVYSKGQIVNKLLADGFDKHSVYDIVKTAAAEGSAELVAVSAKLDMLTNMVMNLAGQVQQNTMMQQQSQDQAAMQADQIAQEEAALEEEMAAAQGGEQAAPEQGMAMQDPHNGMQTPEQQAASEQEMQAQADIDKQMLGQEAAQAPGQEEAQQNPDGMNTSIDPQILQALSDIKDSRIMDVGVISMIAASNDIQDVIAQYKGDILSGASALGRILLNAMTKKDELILDVGEPKYKQLTNSLKTVFTKVSDLYVDIMRLELESDGKMAS